MPTLKVTRDEGWSDRIRKYRILIDGEEAGRIAQGEELEIPVSPGTHTLVAKVDWCSCRPLEFAVSDEPLVIHVENAHRGPRGLDILVTVLFAHRDYLVAKIVQGGGSP